MGKYLIKGSILKCDKGEKESKFNPAKKQFPYRENQQELQKTAKLEFI